MPVSVSIIITAALVFYSIGAWAEKIVGKLKAWHLVFFLMGLACDTIGTGMMLNFAGGLTFDIHGISGSIAIILMLIHALWAFIVLVKNDEKMIGKFHRFSIFVWSIWLIPYFSPMFFAIAERGR
jgi:uncharacterized repeat protein (TIGR03987 family)